MDRVLFIEDMRGGQADLVKTIAKVGFNETPLFNTVRKGVPLDNTKPVMGHNWQYETAEDGDDDNSHHEGSAPAAASSNQLGTGSNHYQIIKHTYGVTGSAEYAKTTEGQTELKRQGTIKLDKQKKTIEKALLSSQAPVQRVESGATPVKGKMGGLLHFTGAEQTHAAAGADVSMDLLRKMLKIGWGQSVPTTHIFANDIQKDKIDDLLESKVLTKQGGTVLKYANYIEIKNLSYAPSVKIILSPYVDADKIVGINYDSIALIYARLTKSYDLARTKDAVEKEIITECTLRVNNPFGATLLSGLKTT